MSKKLCSVCASPRLTGSTQQLVCHECFVRAVEQINDQVERNNAFVRDNYRLENEVKSLKNALELQRVKYGQSPPKQEKL